MKRSQTSLPIPMRPTQELSSRTEPSISYKIVEPFLPGGAEPSLPTAISCFFELFANLLVFHTFLVITPMCFTIHPFIVVIIFHYKCYMPFHLFAVHAFCNLLFLHVYVLMCLSPVTLITCLSCTGQI